MVADGLGDAESNGVSVHDIGRPTGGRIGRALIGAWRAFRAVRRLGPRVVHFHDPELIPVGMMLRLFGHHVVYDVHEDVPRQILTKHWIPALVRRPASWMMSFMEWFGARVFSAIVTATPKIAERFPVHKTVVVQNFPIREELVVPDALPYANRPPVFVYVGGITPLRGAREMVEAIGLVPKDYGARLRLAGSFTPEGLKSKLMALDGWARTDFLGWATRPQVATLLGSARAGLVLFHPAPNHIDAQPNKMFEYMAAGLPVIASDFPLWREIVEGAGCGLLVNPQDPKDIADAMQWMLDHPDEAAAMGLRGREAVKQKYNWEREALKLVDLYRRLVSS